MPHSYFRKLHFHILVNCSLLLAACGTTEELTILHWNDFHSQNMPQKLNRREKDGSRTPYEAGGYAYLKTYLEREKASSKQNLVLHAGDDFQGTPISSITKGESQIELLNLVGPDVMTLGNHEFDYGAENLRSLLPRLRFPVVSANIFDKTRGEFFVPPTVVLERGKSTIGIIGLAPPDLHRLTMRENVRGLDVLDEYKVTAQRVKELEESGVRMIVVLSHRGAREDSILAARVDNIDVIVGGHSHTPLRFPKRVNGTVIVQAGEKGRYLGRLDLEYDPDNGKVLHSDGRLIEIITDGMIPDPVVAAKVAEYENMVAEGLSEVIGTLTTDWKRRSRGDSNIGNWQTDVIREYAGTDIAFQNNGGIRKNMNAGPITVRDMWEMNPFGNEFVSFTVTGRQLRAMIEWQMALEAGDICQVSGMSYVADLSKPTHERVEILLVAGKEVDPVRNYTVATNSYIGGHLHDTFGLPEKDIVVEPVYPPKQDREVFIDHIRAHPEVSSRIEGRITIRGDRRK